MDELLVCILIISLIVYIENDKRRKCQCDDKVEGLQDSDWIIMSIVLGIVLIWGSSLWYSKGKGYFGDKWYMKIIIFILLPFYIISRQKIVPAFISEIFDTSKQAVPRRSLKTRSRSTVLKSRSMGSRSPGWKPKKSNMYGSI